MSLTPATLYPLASAAIFIGFVVVTLNGALIAVLARRLVRSVAGLAMSFVGLAGLYYYLNSPFLALMQLLIYVGAVCVTIMFALMLADPHDERFSLKRELIVGAAALLAGGLFGAALLAVIRQARWMPPAEPVNAGTVADLGRALLTQFGFAFELISVVLLLAILGALVVARSGRRTKP